MSAGESPAVSAPAPELALMGARTGNCLRVTVALEVLGIPFEPIPVDLRGGEQRTAGFLAVNPAGQVPVLLQRRPAGQAPTVLTQSNAILFHLCDLRPGVLFPVAGAVGRAVTLERFFQFATDVIAVGGSSFVLSRAGRDDAAEVLMRRALDAIARAETVLATGFYLAGEQFTLADIAALTVIDAYADRVAWDGLPRLARWFDRVMSRADVRRGLAAFPAP